MTGTLPDSGEQKLGPAEILGWDSEFWGMTVARAGAATLTQQGWAELDAWARARSVDCLFLLAEAEDRETSTLAEDVGFRLVDVRVELAQPTVEPVAPVSVRHHRDSDVETLRKIARSSHSITRFYADPHFPRERCDELYDTWIARSCEGWADAVLVAEHDAEPSGYVTCHFDPSALRGSIGLIAVTESATRNGLGKALVDGALAWCREVGATEATVVTQGANIRAQRLFQQCGFRTASVGLWFHRWYGR